MQQLILEATQKCNLRCKYKTHVGFTTVIASNTDPIDYYLYFRDQEEIYKDGIIDEYREMNEADCLDCWMFRFCSICFARAVEDGRFLLEAKRKQCEELRNTFHRNLMDYCEIAEINPAAFNYMDDSLVG